MPIISTIIPVWNRDVSLTRAIDSALQQEFSAPEWSQEIVVVDDGSTVDVAEVLKPYDGRITLIKHEKNYGAARARNTGIGAAAGEYVAFLDSDDVWLPGKLNAQFSFMRDKSVIACCSSYLLVRTDGSEILSPRVQKEILSLADLVWGCFVSPGSTLVCARSLFDEVGLLDVSLRRLEDWDWMLRFTRSHQLGFLPRPLARIHTSGGGKVDDVLAALSQIEARYQPVLDDADRRHFKAAIWLERAAAYNRGGRLPTAAFSMLRSLWLAPVKHVALATVMHNRLAKI